MVEIYNEHISDLLANSTKIQKEIKIMENKANTLLERKGGN